MAGNWVIQINTRAGDPNFPEVLQGFSRIEDYKKLLAELRRELVTGCKCANMQCGVRICSVVCEYAALNAALHNIEKKKKLLYNISICLGNCYIGVLLPCRPIGY